ncbi:hypothetical protein KSS94_14510 [Pseudomonas fakonensis]|uniref:Uncharacterized protein n=1 Tax=Pseudomonas fakonensis TaxID=2842355 RepID=A0ABX8N164_9PSED|nr:hypothetical protein [Pseudomonas fakonensis]QXH49167.1 hypothetical protein KSS94_14510 [Pseudomonas fakonensis]
MTAETAEGSADRTAAYQDAALEIGKGIALGAVPFLGQAIDAYDTIESCITLYNAETPGAKEEAQFDLVMALVGWIPGPGDGVKKSLRLINKDPERFAPVLFDVLRFVLSECGIKTSPEALLAEVFDSSALAAEIDEVIAGVKDSSAYDALPRWMQSTITTVLAEARDSMPSLVGIVERRVMKWTKMQRNSSAMASGTSRKASTAKPGDQKGDSAHGTNDGDATKQNSSTKQALGDRAYDGLTNEMLGVSGEHIADYICAYKFGWGKDWDGHDKGGDGKWLDGEPSATKPGKLSQGGNPKQAHILYKLTDGANGTGIDAVWRATGEHNQGKKYAIVEAKASRDEDGPKFARNKFSKRKPSINSKLGLSGEGGAFDLIEPVLEDDESAASESTGKKRRKVKKKKPRDNSSEQNKPEVKGEAGAQRKLAKDLMVQMSKEWISANLSRSVGAALASSVKRSYSRHLFFSPIYHLSESPAEHALSLKEGKADSHHDKHDAYHYDEDDVKEAVNKRKGALMKKFGELESLAKEK